MAPSGHKYGKAEGLEETLHKNTDKYIIRLPDGWRDAIKARAAANRRSMSQEILIALEGLVGSAAGGKLAGEAPAAADEAAAR